MTHILITCKHCKMPVLNANADMLSGTTHDIQHDCQERVVAENPKPTFEIVVKTGDNE